MGFKSLSTVKTLIDIFGEFLKHWETFFWDKNKLGLILDYVDYVFLGGWRGPLLIDVTATISANRLITGSIVVLLRHRRRERPTDRMNEWN